MISLIHLHDFFPLFLVQLGPVIVARYVSCGAKTQGDWNSGKSRKAD